MGKDVKHIKIVQLMRKESRSEECCGLVEVAMCWGNRGVESSERVNQN